MIDDGVGTPGIKGTIALVTGAASGIGLAVARHLHASGCSVAVLDRTTDELDQVAAGLPGALAVAADVTRPEEVEDAVAATVDRFGRLDALVHAAGVDDPATKQALADAAETGDPLEVTIRLTDAQWDRMIAVNLTGTFVVTRAALRRMQPQKAGTIVLVASDSGVDGMAGYGHYAASKGGVLAFMRSVAKEVIGQGIRVNAIAPGPVDTPMAARTPASISRSGKTDYASPAAIAVLAATLLGPGGTAVAGSTLVATHARLTV